MLFSVFHFMPPCFTVDWLFWRLCWLLVYASGLFFPVPFFSTFHVLALVFPRCLAFSFPRASLLSGPCFSLPFLFGTLFSSQRYAFVTYIGAPFLDAFHFLPILLHGVSLWLAISVGFSFLGILGFLVLPSIWGLLYGLCVVSSARGLFALVALLCPWALSALVFFAYFAHASAWSLLSSTCLYPFVIFVHSHASTLTRPFSYVHSHASIFMSPFFVAPLASALSTCAHLVYAFFFYHSLSFALCVPPFSCG